MARRLLSLTVGLDIATILEVLVDHLAFQGVHRLQRDGPALLDRRLGATGQRPPEAPRRGGRGSLAASTSTGRRGPGHRPWQSGRRGAGSHRLSPLGGRSGAPGPRRHTPRSVPEEPSRSTTDDIDAGRVRDPLQQLTHARSRCFLGQNEVNPYRLRPDRFFFLRGDFGGGAVPGHRWSLGVFSAGPCRRRRGLADQRIHQAARGSIGSALGSRLGSPVAGTRIAALGTTAAATRCGPAGPVVACAAAGLSGPIRRLTTYCWPIVQALVVIQ